MRFIALTLSVLPLLLSGCVNSEPAREAPPSTSEAPPEEAPEEASLLFVQEAASGSSMRLLGDEERVALVLEGVHNRTLWFTDRPERDAGALATEAFIAAWAKGGDSFLEDPPNGALAIRTLEGEPVVFVLEFLSARYDATNLTLTYTVRPLASGAAFLASYEGARSVLELPASFGEASLFIDDMAAAKSCLPQGSEWDCSTCAPGRLCAGYFGGYYSCSYQGGGMWKCGGCSQWLYSNQDRTGIPCVDTTSTYDCTPQGGGMWKCGGCSQWVYANYDKTGTPCNVSQGSYQCTPTGGSWKCSGCRDWLYSSQDVTGTPCPYTPG